MAVMVVMSWLTSPRCVDLVADGTVDPAPIFSGEIAWEDAPAALAELPRKPLVLRTGR